MPSVDVIIPFFQRSPGPLARAIRSTIGQQFSGHIRILVVDDGSPSPADIDLAGLNQPDHRQVVVHRQPNTGSITVRIASLDLTTPRYVAFRDFDDEGIPDLSAGDLSALNPGADLCFNDRLDCLSQNNLTRPPS